MAQLQERLQDPNRFDRYQAIVQWLRQEHPFEVAYATVDRKQQAQGTPEDLKKICEQLNSRAFQDFIEALAARYPDAMLVVQMDQAAAHRAQRMTWPPNVIPVFQPPDTPEVNPIEQLWQHLRAALAWQFFETLDALRQKLQDVLS
ncbi:transposase [Thermosynechococcus sp.]|uniref:transposase n=1 Tax=Thermosynechococcus sp. TaxID=2814275 RepID=UPI00391A5E9B